MEAFHDEGVYENEEGGAHHKNATKLEKQKKTDLQSAIQTSKVELTNIHLQMGQFTVPQLVRWLEASWVVQGI